MTGLYIHIPFCKSRCIYCGFYSTTRLDRQNRYVEAVCREMELRKSEVDAVGSVYLGGGTPSVLTKEQLCRIFKSIERNYIYNNNVYSLPSLQSGGRSEITLECNPDDVTDEFCATLHQLPVNRISMGAQTFDDARLKFLRRRHNSRQITGAVSKLRHAGIENISIDLMFGFPDETLEDWEKDIECALGLNVEHISAYALMYEEETALFELWKSGKIAKIDEELMRKMYYRLIDLLENAGFEHYEISNFAKRGFRSRHNSSYWNETPYVGLGAAAHSYDGKTRSWNVSDIEAYTAAIERGELPSESEEIDIDTHYNDLITSALRTREGIHLPSLSEKHRNYLIENAQNALRNGFLTIDGDRIHLSRNALFISDSILSDLILV